MSIKIRDAKMLEEAKRDLASGQLTPEDSAALQAAVDAFGGTGESTSGDTSFLQWRPGADETGPLPAENFQEPVDDSPRMAESEAEADGLREAVSGGGMDDAPQGLLSQIGSAVSGWWEGDKKETPAPEEAPEPEAPMPEMSEEYSAPEPEFDEHGPIIKEAPVESHVDSWRSSLSKDARFYAPPAHFGGDGVLTNEVFYEPNVRTVQNLLEDSPELRQAVGAEENAKLSEDSDAYKKAADLMWRAKYEGAKKSGINVVRYSQIKDDLPSFMKPLAWLGENVTTPAMQAVLGVDRTASAGLLQNALGAATGQGDELAALRESTHPGISIPAGIAGAVMPGGVGARLAQGAMKAPGLAGGLASSSMVPRVLAGAGVGAGTAAAEGATQDTGDAMFGVTDGLTPEEFAARRANDMLFGGAFGAGGGLLAEGAEAGMRALRRKHRGLGVIEEAGGSTSLGGIKLPQSMRAREKAYDADPLNVPDPARQAIDELTEPIEKAARTRIGRALETIQKENDEFFNSTRGMQEVAPRPLWNKAVELIRRAYKDGKREPFIHKMQIQGDLGNFTKAKLVRGRMAGQETMTQQEARAIFGDDMVERLLDREVKLMERGSLNNPGSVSSPLGTRPSDVIGAAQEVGQLRKQLKKARIAVEPKAVDAQRLEQWIDSIQSKAKVWRESNQGDEPAKMFDELHASALESRKVISPKWAETKARHSDMLGDTTRGFQEAGLPPGLKAKQRGEEGYKPLEVDERKRLEGALMGAYDTAGQFRAATRALRSLSEDAKLQKTLLELAAHREVDKLRGAQREPSAGVGLTGGAVRGYAYDPKIWDKLQLRAGDPVLRKLARGWRSGDSMAGAAALSQGGPLTEDEQDARALFIAMDMAKVLQEHRKQGANK